MLPIGILVLCEGVGLILITTSVAVLVADVAYRWGFRGIWTGLGIGVLGNVFWSMWMLHYLMEVVEPALMLTTGLLPG